MKPNSTSYVVLGMLHVGARSGYEIKRLVAISARFFWTLSSVQIYPELKRLQAAGLIKGRDQPSGGRRRRLYSLTPAGRRVLREWLLDGSEPSVEWRDEGLLKLFFADALEEGDRLGPLQSVRERSERLAERFRAEIVPAARAGAEHSGHDYPLISARFGLGFHEWVAEWCSTMEREIAAGESAAPVG
jgi:PadR family transcriptional regulator AphA